MTKSSQVDKSADDDIVGILKKTKFEFNPLDDHLKHCYYSPFFKPHKENAIQVIGEMLLLSAKQDPALSHLKSLISGET